jgi:hypothetical protein
MEEVTKTESEPKPKILYHASPNRDLQVIETRQESVRDKNEGPVVFATHDEACASLFLVNSNDSWTFKGRINGVHYHIISDRKRFEELDKGGSIYEVPSDSFERKINDESWQSLEWTSTKPVNPIRKTDYSSGLEAMIDKGVLVYFVDKEMFEELTKNHRINSNLLKTLVSENQTRKH